MKKLICAAFAVLVIMFIAGCNMGVSRYTPPAAATPYPYSNNTGTDVQDNLNNFRADNNRTGNMDRNNNGLRIPKTNYNGGATIVNDADNR